MEEKKFNLKIKIFVLPSENPPQGNCFFKFLINLEFFCFAKTLEKHTWFNKRNLLTLRAILVEGALLPSVFFLTNSSSKDRERVGFY